MTVTMAVAAAEVGTLAAGTSEGVAVSWLDVSEVEKSAEQGHDSRDK